MYTEACVCTTSNHQFPRTFLNCTFVRANLTNVRKYNARKHVLITAHNYSVEHQGYQSMHLGSKRD